MSTGTYAVLGTISSSSYPAMPYGSQTTIQFIQVGTSDTIEITLDDDQVELLRDALSTR